MRSNDYHFVTRWCFQAKIEEVADVLQDIESLPDWWPVYTKVRRLEEGRVELHTKARLPFTLRWQYCLIESDPPNRFVIEATGDFVGKGIWRLAQNGQLAEVEFDWRIRAEKPVLKTLSWALKPMFSNEHHWAMAQGQQCLCAEIKRRRRAGRTLDLATATR